MKWEGGNSVRSGRDRDAERGVGSRQGQPK